MKLSERATSLLASLRAAAVDAQRRLVDARVAMDRAAADVKAIQTAVAAIEALDIDGTVKVEGPEYFVLLEHTVPSESNPTRLYQVEARLYGTDIVLTCDCPRFFFTRGRIEHGERENCKHIVAFRLRSRDWPLDAKEKAGTYAARGTIYFAPGVSYEWIAPRGGTH